MDALPPNSQEIDYSQFDTPAQPEVDYSQFDNDDLMSSKFLDDMRKVEIEKAKAEPVVKVSGKVENFNEKRGAVPQEETEAFLVDVDGKNKMLAPAAASFKALQEYASQEGIPLTLNNAYRGYEEQARLVREGYPAAPAGYSSHQTGLAADFNLAPLGANSPKEKRLVELAKRFDWYQPYPEREDEFHHFVYSKSKEEALGIEAASHRGEMPDAATKPVKKPKYTQKEALARNAAMEFGLDPKLLAAQIQAESGWNPTARSPVGARGMLQMMPETLVEVLGQMKSKGLIGSNITAADYDKDANLQFRAGAFYMDRMRRNTKSYPEALAAFNAGLGGLDDMKKSGRTYNETGEYVAKILGVDRATADDWILNGGGPKGTYTGGSGGGNKPGSSGGGAGGTFYRTPANPYETNLQFMSGNSKIAEAYKKYGQTDKFITAMANLFPEYGDEFVDSMRDPLGTLTRMPPDEAKEKLRTEAKTFDASSYWQGFAKRALNEFTFGASAYYDLFGVGKLEKDELDSLDAIELDENSSAAARLFTSIGPEAVGLLAGMMTGGALIGAGKKLLGKGVTKAVAAMGTEAAASKIISKGVTSGNLISSNVSRWLTASSGRSFAGNFASATASGLLFTIPNSMAAYSREMNEAELRGASELEAAAAGWGAFQVSMFLGLGASVAAPVLGAMGGMLAVGAANSAPAVKGAAGVAAKYLVPETVKNAAKAVGGAYQDSWMQSMMQRSAKFSWDALSVAQKAPIIGGFISAAKALPKSVQEGFITHSRHYREHLEAFGKRANFLDDLAAGDKTADMLGFSLDAHSKSLNSFGMDSKAVRAEASQLRQQVEQQRDKLLNDSGQDALIREFSQMSPGAQGLVGGGQTGTSNGARGLFEARKVLQEHLNPHGASSRLDELERAMVVASREGLSPADAASIVQTQKELYKLGRAKELIDEPSLQVANQKLDKMLQSIPPSAGGKTSDGVKQFVKENTTEARRFFDQYVEAQNFAQKLGDTTSDKFLIQADAQLNKLAAWEISTQGKAVQALQKLLGYADEVEHRIMGTMDPRNIETNYQVLEKHLADAQATVASQQANLKTFKEMSAAQAAKVEGMTDDEILAMPRANLSLADAISNPQAAAELEQSLIEGQRISKYITPTEEALEVEKAISMSMHTKTEGMDWTPEERFGDIAQGLRRLAKKEAYGNLTSDHTAAIDALREAGYAETAIDTSGDLISRMVGRVKTLTEEAEKLSKVRSLEAIRGDLAGLAGMSKEAYALTSKTNLEEMRGLMAGLLSNKSIQTAFNEKTAISQQMRALDDDFGEMLAKAQSPDDIAKLMTDINTAAGASKVDSMVSSLRHLDERAALESSTLQKNLARDGGSHVVTNEVIMSALNTSEATTAAGSHLASIYRKEYESSFPDIMSRIEGRFKATPELKEFENFKGRLSFHLTAAMHDTFTGKNPKALDHLIEKGFSGSGALPELAEALYPIKRLAQTIAESRANPEVKGLTEFFSSNFTPKYSRLEYLRKYSKISEDSPFYGLEKALASTKDPADRIPMFAVRSNAYEAEAALSQAYKEQFGKNMPDSYWEKVVLDPRSQDPEFLRGMFTHKGQLNPLTDEQLKRYAQALPYRYLATKPEDMIEGFVRTATAADSGRRFLSTLAKLESPDSGVPYIIDITDPRFGGKVPEGTISGVGTRQIKSTVPSEYKSLQGEGTHLPIRGLSVGGRYVHASNLRIHPALYDTLQRSYLSKDTATTAGQEFMNFVKHSVLVGSPSYFLMTGTGQMLKESGFSMGKALGLTHAGSTLAEHGPETFQRAISAGLNLNSVVKNTKGVGDYVLKRTPLAQLRRDTLENPLESMRRKPTLREKAGAVGRQISEGMGELDLAINDPMVFNQLRDMQVGAWMNKVSTIWETHGRDLIRSGKSYQEALHEVEKAAATAVNKNLMSMHRTFLSDDLRKSWFNINLAPGIMQSRLATAVDGFMAMRNAVAEKLFPGSAKALGENSMFSYGITSPEMQKAYRADAMKMFMYGTGAAYVFNNAMSYALNGHSTFQNAPGKEDQVRIGMNYYKSTVFGFDSIFNRLLRSAPGIGDLVDYGRKEMTGNPAVSDSFLTAAARTVGSIAHPVLGVSADLLANKTIGNNMPITTPGAGIDNVASVGRYAVSEYAPWVELASIPVNAAMGNGPVKTDVATGETLGLPSTLGEVLGAYVSHSPPAKEFDRGVKARKAPVVNQLRTEYRTAMVSVASMPDGEEREKLRLEARERATTGYPIKDKALRAALGEDFISLSPRQMKSIEDEVFREESFSVSKAAKDYRKQAAERQDYLLDNSRSTLNSVLQETLGERI